MPSPEPNASAETATTPPTTTSPVPNGTPPKGSDPHTSDGDATRPNRVKPAEKIAAGLPDLRHQPWPKGKEPPPGYRRNDRTGTLQLRTGPAPRLNKPKTPARTPPAAAGLERSQPSPADLAEPPPQPSIFERFSGWVAARLNGDPIEMVTAAREAEQLIAPIVTLGFELGTMASDIDAAAVPVPLTARLVVHESTEKRVLDGIEDVRKVRKLVLEQTSPSTLGAHATCIAADVVAYAGASMLSHPLAMTAVNAGVLVLAVRAMRDPRFRFPRKSDRPAPQQLAPKNDNASATTENATP